MATLRKDLFAPEVYEDMGNAEFKKKIVMAQAANQDDTLVGMPGETVVFERWETLSEIEDIDEEDVLEVESMTQSASSATIKEAGKAVGWSDRAKLVGKGNLQDQLIQQYGELTARKVDSDLMSAALLRVPEGRYYADGRPATPTNPLSFNAGETTGFSYNPIVDAAQLVGDDFETDEWAGLFINSLDRATAMKDTQFQQANQGDGYNGLITRGRIGDVNGLAVVVSDRVPVGKSLLLKKNALSVKWKQRPWVEQDRDILARKTVVAIHLHYATKRVNDNGVIEINWNTAK
ncbi:major capsid protein, N4-gp56 family [Pseudarthrobacter equi]|uniref:Major capsid protein, N4-gp56 family n=1 Tax=Pseudarthrobacter equi TaxID=728066 RepID=A0A1H2A882_9MICC|nr:phage head protein [Pseudarthrobacter equi]SDT42119.1 major capsid protein, N4-gp56 family [Pseudarthrobacter equi]